MNTEKVQSESYDNGKFSLTYPEESLSDTVLKKARENKDKTALSFLNKKISYKVLSEKICTFATALYSCEIKKGDRVIVCLPNIPQAVFAFYGANRIGAVAVFIHPLSGNKELECFIDKTNAKMIITLDSLEEKFENVFERTGLKQLVITSLADEADCVFKIANIIKKRPFKSHKAISYKDFEKKAGGHNIYLSLPKAEDTAVILFSGGTTGEPKGVELTNLNMNALALQTSAACGMKTENFSMVSLLPMFHGFGLGICVHSVLVNGGEAILLPRFSTKGLAAVFRKHRPDYLVGVPSVFERILSEEAFDKLDLSCLCGVFSGGDSLSQNLKERFDLFLKEHKADVKIRQGYGTAECVAASCLMPIDKEKKESIGVPYPDTFFKITHPDTNEEVSCGETGEICIRGKTVMKGYFEDKRETKKALKNHSDGFIWLHTGDMGSMDEDGFVYFKGRIKRMIVSNGYNIYPEYIERISEKSGLVKGACVVAVKDRKKGEVPVLFAVSPEKALSSGGLIKEDDESRKISEYLKTYVSAYAVPQKIYYVDNLPKTPLGKTDYKALEKLAAELYK